MKNIATAISIITKTNIREICILIYYLCPGKKCISGQISRGKSNLLCTVLYSGIEVVWFFIWSVFVLQMYVFLFFWIISELINFNSQECFQTLQDPQLGNHSLVFWFQNLNSNIRCLGTQWHKDLCCKCLWVGADSNKIIIPFFKTRIVQCCMNCAVPFFPCTAGIFSFR